MSPPLRASRTRTSGSSSRTSPRFRWARPAGARRRRPALAGPGACRPCTRSASSSRRRFMRSTARPPRSRFSRGRGAARARHRRRALRGARRARPFGGRIRLRLGPGRVRRGASRDRAPLPDSAVRILDVGCGSAGALTGLSRRKERRHHGNRARAASRRRGATALRPRPRRRPVGRAAPAGRRRRASSTPSFSRTSSSTSRRRSRRSRRLAASPRRARSSSSACRTPGTSRSPGTCSSGRFDPAPSGLADAGHLRWFSRDFLEEAILEAGWSRPRIERERGAPAPDPSAFLALAAASPDADRDSLETYQWIATAVQP